MKGIKAAQAPSNIVMLVMKWALANDEPGNNLITPIGYQPFMRCSTQHRYTMYINNETYDLLKDPLFDKFRIEHSEDFCRWIFEEMDCESKVYPHDDIPNIEKYMETIRNTRIISQATFENLMQHAQCSRAKSPFNQAAAPGGRIYHSWRSE